MRFVVNRHRFEHIRSQLDQHVRLDGALPGSVLRHHPRGHAFFAFDELFNEAFWGGVQAIALEAGDTVLNFSVLEPHPTNYFFREFGYFAALEIPVGVDVGTIIDVLCSMPDDSPADSLVHNSQTIAVASPSGAVVAWADRSLDLGLFASFGSPGNRLTMTLPDTVRTFDAYHAIAMMSPTFLEGLVPDQVKNEILRNYG